SFKRIERVRLLGGRLTLKRLAGLLRQLDLQRLPRRLRLLAAHHHDVGEDVPELLSLLVIDGGGPADEPPQEPARTVYADEPHGLWRHRRAGGALRNDAGQQLRTEGPVLLGALTAHIG